MSFDYYQTTVNLICVYTCVLASTQLNISDSISIGATQNERWPYKGIFKKH